MGTELQKMMLSKSSSPVVCMTYIVKYGFYPVVFALPPNLSTIALRMMMPGMGMGMGMVKEMVMVMFACGVL